MKDEPRTNLHCTEKNACQERLTGAARCCRTAAPAQGRRRGRQAKARVTARIPTRLTTRQMRRGAQTRRGASPDQRDAPDMDLVIPMSGCIIPALELNVPEFCSLQESRNVIISQKTGWMESLVPLRTLQQILHVSVTALKWVQAGPLVLPDYTRYIRHFWDLINPDVNVEGPPLKANKSGPSPGPAATTLVK